jgi:hypothetical protein
MDFLAAEIPQLKLTSLNTAFQMNSDLNHHQIKHYEWQV